MSALVLSACAGGGEAKGGDGDPTNSCVPGQQVACECLDGGSSVKVCADDGSWGACAACPDTEKPPPGAGGSGGSSGSGGSAGSSGSGGSGGTEVLQPEIQVDPPELSFEGIEQDPAPAPQMVTVTNVGTGDLDFSVTSPEPWITVTPSASMLAPGASGTLEVAVDSSMVLPGTHKVEIEVSDPNAPAPGAFGVKLRLNELPDAVAPGASKLNVAGFTLDKTDPENPDVIVTFSRGVDESTLVPPAVVLTDDATGVAIDTTVSYDPDRRQAKFTPITRLVPATLYTITITDGVRASGGGGSLDQNDYDSGNQPFVKTFDLAMPTLRLKGHVDIDGISDVWWDEEAKILTVAGRNSSHTAWVIDATDPTDPKIASNVDAGWAQDIKVHDNLMYATNEPGGVHIWDVTDPYNPVYQSLIYDNNTGSVHNTFIYKQHAYLVSNTTGRIEVYNIGNPQSPSRVGSISNPNQGAAIHDLTIVDDILYGGFLDGGLTIANVADPANPVYFSHTSYADDFCHNAWPTADHKFVVTSDEYVGGRLRVWDIQDNTNPQLISSWTPDARSVIHNAQVEGNLVFMSHYTQGLQVADISDPYNPFQAQFFDTWPGRDTSADMSGAWGVHVRRNLIAVGDTDNGVFIFRYQE